MAAIASQRYFRIADAKTIANQMQAHGGLERIPAALISKANSARETDTGFFTICPDLIRTYIRYEQDELDKGNIKKPSDEEAIVDLISRFSAEFKEEASVIQLRVTAIYSKCIAEHHSII